jgi:hypothetical protein
MREGFVVRSQEGKVLGIFNTEYFLANNTEGAAEYKEANFALAGNTLGGFSTGKALDGEVGGGVAEPMTI